MTTCITHCLKDLTCNLDLIDNTLSSYGFRHWPEHCTDLISEDLNKWVLEFTEKLCRHRSPKLRHRGVFQLTHEYDFDEDTPNPELGLRLGFNTPLMLIHLDRLDLYTQVQRSYRPSAVFSLNALHIAARTGNDHVVELLLDENTFPPMSTILNACDSNGHTPLMTACQYGRGRVVKSLLRCPFIDVNATERRLRHTALYIASQNGHRDVVKLLLGHQCDPPLDVHAVAIDGTTALHCASSSGHLAIVQMLVGAPIEPPTDVNKPDNKGRAAIHHASGQGHLVVQWLLAYPTIKAHAVTKGGRRALDIASQYGHLDIVRALLNHPTNPPINVDGTDDGGWTALHYASYHGQLAVIRDLLGHGATLNIRTKEGETALMLASRGIISRDREGRKRACQLYLLSVPGIDLRSDDSFASSLESFQSYLVSLLPFLMATLVEQLSLYASYYIVYFSLQCVLEGI